MNAARFQALFFFVSAIAIGACGGTVAPVGDGDGGTSGSSGGSSSGSSGTSSGSSGGSSSSGGGGDQGPCPSTTPPSGGSCTSEGVTCEYGTDPNTSCNATFVCQGGKWLVPRGGGQCPSGATCPATFGDVPQSKQCKPEFETCVYAQATCYCTRSGPVFGENAVWQCVPQPDGCPTPRPALGSACSKSQAGQKCNYGACYGGVAEICKGGYWQTDSVVCPL